VRPSAVRKEVALRALEGFASRALEVALTRHSTSGVLPMEGVYREDHPGHSRLLFWPESRTVRRVIVFFWHGIWGRLTCGV
jgi:hypothetical protein